MFANALSERMAAFVLGIGIDLRAGRLPADTFLPGPDIQHGAIVVDEEGLAYPGDLLHEAGHAALRMRNLAPEIVFHPHRYKGGAQALIDIFTGGGNSGLPLLARYGLTVEPKHAAARGVECNPRMLRWLC